MHPNQKTPARLVAFGGVMAALAVTIMSLGGLIPVATYVSPVLCAMVLQLVLLACGRRLAWAWFGAVAILSALLSPDKEAAFVFVFLGYYPILKRRLDGWIFPIVWKALYFNVSILLCYWLLLHALGLEDLGAELAEFGKWMTAALLILGNVTFFLLDRLLSMPRFGGGRR